MRKMMLLAMSLVLVLGLGASGAWGAVNNIPDTTLILSTSGAGATFGWRDVVGADVPFNTFNATFDTSSHVLTVFTNWDPTKSVTPIPGVSFSTADLFLGFKPNVNEALSTAFAAVNLGNLIGANTGTVFYNPTFQTSFDLFNGSGLSEYGGKYTTNSNAPGPPSFNIPVHATGGTSTGTATVTWAQNPSDPPFSPAFSFAIDLDQITGFNPNIPDFLWGTATCGNDVIVPLPPSLLLLGSGLLGLGIMRRRTKQQ